MGTVTRFTWRKQEPTGSVLCMRSRSGCTATAVGHYIYVIGGINDTLICRLDVNKKTWTELGISRGVTRVKNHTANVHEGCILMFGIKPPSAESQAELHAFDIALNKVEVVPTFGQERPPFKVGHTADVWEEASLLLLFGGYPMDGFGQLYILNLTVFQWRRARTKGESPEERHTHTSAMVGSRLYVYGGFGAGGIYLNSLYVIDCDHGVQAWTWHRVSIESLEVHSRMKLVHLGDGRLMILGGTQANSSLLVVEVKGSKASWHKAARREAFSEARSQEQQRYVISGSAPLIAWGTSFAEAHGKIYAISEQAIYGKAYYELLLD